MASPIMPIDGPFEAIIKLIGGMFAVIIGLITYTWHRKERADDKMAEALIKHVTDDDRIHDTLFTEFCRMDKELVEIKTRQADCEKCP